MLAKRSRPLPEKYGVYEKQNHCQKQKGKGKNVLSAETVLL